MDERDRAELQRAADALARGEIRRARVIASTLGADVLPAPRIPRCAWIARLLHGENPRVDDARREIDALLSGERVV